MAAFLSSGGILLKEKYIFVLLGPSGSGKTTFGLQQLEQDREKVMFLSTGLELRNQNIMSVWQEADLTAIKGFCHKSIDKTFENFQSSETHQMLILDCVKDLEDAEYIAAQAKKHGLEITRALLFDIDPKELEINWIRRKEDRDFFSGSARAYLENWHMKSNDLVNYYKKSKLLNSSECTMRMFMTYTRLTALASCYPSLLDILKWPCDEHLPVLPSPVLLSNSAKIKTILAELLMILQVNELQFTLPASFVHCLP